MKSPFVNKSAIYYKNRGKFRHERERNLARAHRKLYANKINCTAEKYTTRSSHDPLVKSRKRMIEREKGRETREGEGFHREFRHSRGLKSILLMGLWWRRQHRTTHTKNQLLFPIRLYTHKYNTAICSAFDLANVFRLTLFRTWCAEIFAYCSLNLWKIK